jgi:hypothetical protein
LHYQFFLCAFLLFNSRLLFIFTLLISVLQFRDISLTPYGAPLDAEAHDAHNVDGEEAPVAGDNQNVDEYGGVDDNVNEWQVALFDDEWDDGFQGIDEENNVSCVFICVIFCMFCLIFCSLVHYVILTLPLILSPLSFLPEG